MPADDRGQRSRRCRGTASSHVGGRAAAFYAGSLRNCIPAEAGVALMSISVIRAAFECDGCGKPFKVDIEPSTKNWMRRQDMLSIAENAIRGGMTSDGEFCSIQADMHLRSEEHTSELQSLMRISYAVFCL